MARVDAHELEDITEMLSTLGTKWEGTAKQGLYEGAKVLKEEIERVGPAIHPGVVVAPVLKEVKEVVMNAIRMCMSENTAE